METALSCSRHQVFLKKLLTRRLIFVIFAFHMKLKFSPGLFSALLSLVVTATPASAGLPAGLLGDNVLDSAIFDEVPVASSGGLSRVEVLNESGRPSQEASRVTVESVGGLRQGAKGLKIRIAPGETQVSLKWSVDAALSPSTWYLASCLMKAENLPNETKQFISFSSSKEEVERVYMPAVGASYSLVTVAVYIGAAEVRQFSLNVPKIENLAGSGASVSIVDFQLRPINLAAWEAKVKSEPPELDIAPAQFSSGDLRDNSDASSGRVAAISSKPGVSFLASSLPEELFPSFGIVELEIGRGEAAAAAKDRVLLRAMNPSSQTLVRITDDIATVGLKKVLVPIVNVSSAPVEFVVGSQVPGEFIAGSLTFKPVWKPSRDEVINTFYAGVDELEIFAP